MTIDVDEKDCGSECDVRVAVMAVNGKIEGLRDNLGSTSAKTLFFDDHNSNNDFKLIYGKQKDVNAALQSLQIVPNLIDKQTQVLFRAQRVDARNLNA